jgi:DNA polymerase delta subunit 2
LEDESGRVQLIGPKLDKESLVTGMVVGILGKEDPASGAFEVYEVCYPGLPKQQTLPSPNKGKRYMFFFFTTYQVCYMVL